jgi:hypothetical protein
MLAYTITNDTITLVIDGHPYTIPRSAANAQAVLAELREESPDEDRLIELSSVRAAMSTYGQGHIVFKADGSVEWNDKPLPPILASRVLACFDANVPFEYLLKFFERLQLNPSQRAVTELYAFLEHQGMPITPEGHILAYKGVQDSYWSCTGNNSTIVLVGRVDAEGRILNDIGARIEVQRNSVDDNCDRTCSTGLHAGSLAYATGFGARTVIVSIDPKDVVSIPSDCEGQKLRCCAYTVVADYQGRMADGAVRDERCPYATAFDPARCAVDEAPGLCVGFSVFRKPRVDVNWFDRGYAAGERDATNSYMCAPDRESPTEGDSDDNGDMIDEEDCITYGRGYAQGYADNM